MKKVYLPYYISRAIISIAFALLVTGLNWSAVFWALLLFTGFLLYLHSGWFSIDPSRPLTPLRRDDHGKEIQRKALLSALVIAIAVWVVSPLIARIFHLSPMPGAVAFAIGVLSYLALEFILFYRMGSKRSIQ